MSYAYEVLQKNLSYSIILNISNECAVNAFLKRKIKFGNISQIINLMLNGMPSENIQNINDIFEYSDEVTKYTLNELSKFF